MLESHAHTRHHTSAHQRGTRDGGNRAPERVSSIWADEGAVPRKLDFDRYEYDFEGAIDREKIDALLAWNGCD